MKYNFKLKWTKINDYNMTKLSKFQKTESKKLYNLAPEIARSSQVSSCLDPDHYFIFFHTICVYTISSTLRCWRKRKNTHPEH